MGAEWEQGLYERVLQSKAGRDVSPKVVLAAVRWALERYPRGEAEKAAKTRLHQLYGSYVGVGWLKAADKLLASLETGNLPPGEIARGLLSLHGSTRERLERLEECYGRIFTAVGRPASVLDVASGMNPLSFWLLDMKGIELLALDAGQGVAAVLSRFFAATGMARAQAIAGDAMDGLPSGPHGLPSGPFDLALVMKFLPLAERIERGGALKLLDAVNARHTVVSFPTRSLSGRNVGMEGNYSAWFEGLGLSGQIVERFVCGDEVFYILNTPPVASRHPPQEGDK